MEPSPSLTLLSTVLPFSLAAHFEPLMSPADFGEPSSSKWSLLGAQHWLEQLESEAVWLHNTHLLHRPFLDMKANDLPL